ncbi:uncharacterized protein LOC135111972 isoform X3 [Scylla paramamosain]|uniref:uncharacterized protein LOC135111972 isoform X3 n=1 Tax=Scylla paramamosain TaxID=85552 RepID=UPI003082CBB9
MAKHVSIKFYDIGGRSFSHHSTRLAPHPPPTSITTTIMTTTRVRGESPKSLHSTTTTTTAGGGHDYQVSRRTPSVDNQSSVDSRGHRSPAHQSLEAWGVRRDQQMISVGVESNGLAGVEAVLKEMEWMVKPGAGQPNRVSAELGLHSSWMEWRTNPGASQLSSSEVL